MSRSDSPTSTTASTDADLRSGTTQLRVGRNRSTNCRCGQQLDVCARAHCPRCGRTLRRR